MHYMIQWIFFIGIHSICLINADPAPNSCSSTGQVVPSTAAVGQTVTINISVTCNIASGNNLVVDLEIYSTTGSQKYQKYWTNQNLQLPTTTRAYQGFWTIPAGTSLGNYMVNIGVFDANWGTNYYWNNNAATIVVQNSPTTTPATSNNWNSTVTHTMKTVNSITVDCYSWYDSNGLQRTVSLKQQGNGNSGNGGYAVQMTYIDPATNQTVTINADDSDSHGGFGYFVSHERYRTFSNGKNSIAGRVFNTDDSPLGRGIRSDGQTLTSVRIKKIFLRFYT